MVLAVAADAKDVLVLLLGKWGVLRVYVLHDARNLLGIKTPTVLEPHNPAVNSTVVAVGSKLAGQFLEHSVLVELGSGSLR